MARIVLILVMAVVVAACGQETNNGRTTVAAAFYPLAYAAGVVGGTKVDVENLTPPGAEPHDLELAPKGVRRIQSADVVLYLSHGFQPAVADAINGARGTKVDVLARLPLRPATGGEADLTADPHVWLDPVLFARIVRRIGVVLHNPHRANVLIGRLRTLDTAYRRGLANCARRDIVTSHAAFGYLARRYRLQQVAITGLAPESEPSPQQLAHVVRVVRHTHTSTVFFEKLVSPRLSQTVARESGASTAVLDPIEGVTPAEAKRGLTYLSLMHRNLAALRKALGCR